MNGQAKKESSPKGKILLACGLVLLAILILVLRGIHHKCGEHVTWSFNRKTGELVLRGSGPMFDYDYDGNRTTAPWRRFESGITSVTAEEGITSIGDHAFMYCSGLTCVRLPDSVERIGYEAFERCDCLFDLDLPAGLTSLDGGFWSTPIRTLYIPAGLSELQGSLFDGMYELEEFAVDPDNPNFRVEDGAIYTADMTTLVRFPPARECPQLTVPEGVEEIGSCAFRFCGGLGAVTLPESVTELGWAAFEGCSSLTDVNIPGGVTALPGNFLEDSYALTSFTVPGSVREIGSYAFAWTGAESILVEEGVETIGQSAFYGSSITSITLPGNLISLDRDALESCYDLTDIYFGGTVDQWTELAGGMSFDSEYGVTVWCSDGEYYA